MERKNIICALEPSFFEIFQNEQQIWCNHLSIPFHSCITHENKLKYERALPMGSKITPLVLDAKVCNNWKKKRKQQL